MNLGESLVQAGLVQQADVEAALAHQAQEGGTLGQSLVALGLLTQEQIEALQKRANASPLDPPADGAFAEDRLLKFLEVRKRIFAVYEKHRATFEAMSKREPQGLEGLKALGMKKM